MKTKTDIMIAQNVYLTDKPNSNKNCLIVGSSGTGKTGSYVIQQLLNGDESVLVCDTKMNLYSNYGKYLAKKGFKVVNINLVEPDRSTHSFDPLDYIRFEEKNGKRIYNQKDIITVSQMLCPVKIFDREPFWTSQAQMFISVLIAFVLDEFEGSERNLASVLDVYRYICESEEHNVIPFMEDYCLKHPDSFGANRYKMISSCFRSEKTWASIKYFVADALQIFEFGAVKKLLTKKRKFSISDLGRRKTACFVNISDTDRSLDTLGNLLYNQTMNVLCSDADRNKTSKLDVPCRLILDDAMSNVHIENLESVISVVRSRDISVSMCLQSLSQITSYYGRDRANSIINNCDTFYYLGTSCLETAQYVSMRANIPVENVLSLDSSMGILLRRGEKPMKVKKIVPYSMVPKADFETAASTEKSTEEKGPDLNVQI